MEALRARFKEMNMDNSEQRVELVQYRPFAIFWDIRVLKLEWMLENRYHLPTLDEISKPITLFSRIGRLETPYRCNSLRL